MGHKINIGDMDLTFENTINLAGCYGSGENKSLDLKVFVKDGKPEDSYFVVSQKKKQVHKTRDLADAVKVYNNL